MDNLKFNEIVKNQFKICENILCEKSKEYDFGKDRLNSFKKGSFLLDTDPLNVLIGYFTKHIISIFDMYKFEKEYSIEKWEEKITDSINYLILLKALLIENRENNYEKN